MSSSIGWLSCVLALALAGSAAAEVIGFVDNPEGNSADWRAKIAELGETVVEEVNFNSHPVSPIIPNLNADVGVTFVGTGKIRNVRSGAGPGQRGTRSPRSQGEGLHRASNHVVSSGARGDPGAFTISFDQPVTGAGVFLVDLFNPEGNHPVKLEAFAGRYGTGDFLGSFNAAPFNFQPNFKYFMGVISTEGNIMSIRIDVTIGFFAGDILGLDDVLFAGGTNCTYTIKRVKPSGGCRTCPPEGEPFETVRACDEVSQCPRKLRTTIICPKGEGRCKLKGKSRRCL